MTGFPDPAARTPDEVALLTGIVADLRNDLPKLIYADWLDDRGDDRGEFLRLFVHAYHTGKEPPEPSACTPGPWLALTGCELLAGLRRYDLTHLTAPLLRLARPVIVMTAQLVDDQPLSVGASRFGGDPDLAIDAGWPTDANGPLPFLAQFNLADFAGIPAAAELPPVGLLSVFYDGDGWGGGDRGWRLVHTPPGHPLAQQATPAEAAREYLSTTPMCRLVFAEGLDIPDRDSPWAAELDLKEDGYGPRNEGYHELLGPDDRHQLLGYPRLIQGDVLRSADARHLLSLGSDNVPGWCWGDWGTLYYTLPAAKLAAGRLADDVRFEMQCS